MKNLIPLLMLTLAGLACGRFQSSSNPGNAGNTSSNDKPIIRKVVDVPALYGKSKDEVIKAVTEGTKKNDFSDWMDFEFPQGTLRVSLAKNKAETFTFTLPMYGGDFLVDTPENLGILTGINLAGKSPDVTLDGFVSYKKEKMGSVPVEITLDRKSDKDRFYSLTLRKGS